jgi:DNA-binding transcriptional regulator YiaG
MKCDKCGGPTTVEPNTVRRYKDGGLPHVELHGVEVMRCAACHGESIAVPQIAELRRTLAHLFVNQRRLLAPVELRFLRGHLGMSCAELAHEMGLGREMVLRWERGSNQIGPVADRLLRLLVVMHESGELRARFGGLPNDPAPEKLATVDVWNRDNKGWEVEDSDTDMLAQIPDGKRSDQASQAVATNVKYEGGHRPLHVTLRNGATLLLPIDLLASLPGINVRWECLDEDPSISMRE